MDDSRSNSIYFGCVANGIIAVVKICPVAINCFRFVNFLNQSLDEGVKLEDVADMQFNFFTKAKPYDNAAHWKTKHIMHWIRSMPMLFFHMKQADDPEKEHLDHILGIAESLDILAGQGVVGHTTIAEVLTVVRNNLDDFIEHLSPHATSMFLAECYAYTTIAS